MICFDGDMQLNDEISVYMRGVSIYLCVYVRPHIDFPCERMLLRIWSTTKASVVPICAVTCVDVMPMLIFKGELHIDDEIHILKLLQVLWLFRQFSDAITHRRHFASSLVFHRGLLRGDESRGN